MLNYTITYNNQTIFTSSTPLASIPIKYNNQTLTTLSTATTILLTTDGTVMASNVQIGGAILNCNGKCMKSNITITSTNS